MARSYILSMPRLLRVQMVSSHFERVSGISSCMVGLYILCTYHPAWPHLQPCAHCVQLLSVLSTGLILVLSGAWLPVDCGS